MAPQVVTGCIKGSNVELEKLYSIGNVKLVSCLTLHGKKSMRNVLNHFIFIKNKFDVRKRIFFLFYQIVMESLFL